MNDTLDKIVFSYFAAVTKEKIMYKNKIIYPKPLSITISIFKAFECLSNCAACCSVFSLDYIPNEKRPKKLIKRKILLNNTQYNIYSDVQKENNTKHCKYVNKEGRCKIHRNHPFSCDFELIGSFIYKNKNSPNRLTTRIYSRGWNMTKIDGTKGVLCTLGFVDKTSIKEIKRKINRLNEWCNYFKIKSWCPDIINWIEKGNIQQKRIFKLEE